MEEIDLQLSENAIRQIESIYAFHESSSPGKGGNFLEVLWDCLEEIQQNPQKWQFLGSRSELIRRAITRSPKSIILYAIEENEVVVYNIYDSRQDWK